MTTFAPHRDTVEAFVDCMHGGADKVAFSGILAEDVVLYGPLGDEPVTGRAAVLEAMQGVGTVATDLTYKEVLSGETHHAAYFRLQIEDTQKVGTLLRRPLYFRLIVEHMFEWWCSYAKRFQMKTPRSQSYFA
jgi:hypothetical protein